jgi:putative FmdB family regulatory protein
MPFYEYECSNCRHHLEELQNMSDPPLVSCPNCGKETLKRLIGTGGGIIFKGSGFYLTDYKNAKSRDSSEKSGETKNAEGKTADTKTAETKSSETKSAEAKSTETKSTETKSTGTKSTGTKPTGTKPVNKTESK